MSPQKENAAPGTNKNEKQNATAKTSTTTIVTTNKLKRQVRKSLNAFLDRF